MATEQIPGGWGNWIFVINDSSVITNGQIVFNETLGKLIGVKYELIAYRMQVVNGINYEFIATAKPATIAPERVDLVEARVHVTSQGQHVIERISPLGPEPNGQPGGWHNWQVPPSADALKAFAKMPMLTGVKYEPYASTQQLVNGTNFCILCSQTYVVLPPLRVNAVLIYLHQDLKGNVTITRIEPIN